MWITDQRNALDSNYICDHILTAFEIHNRQIFIFFRNSLGRQGTQRAATEYCASVAALRVPCLNCYLFSITFPK
jgi:hypothetical protein